MPQKLVVRWILNLQELGALFGSTLSRCSLGADLVIAPPSGGLLTVFQQSWWARARFTAVESNCWHFLCLAAASCTSTGTPLARPNVNSRGFAPRRELSPTGLPSTDFTTSDVTAPREEQTYSYAHPRFVRAEAGPHAAILRLSSSTSLLPSLIHKSHNDPHQQESRGGLTGGSSDSNGSGGSGDGDGTFVGAGMVGGNSGSGINFIGADGSVLDKLPSGMEMVMDSDAMCSLDYGLGGLTTLSPVPGQEEPDRELSPPHHLQQPVKLEKEERWQQQQPHASAADGWALHSTPTPDGQGEAKGRAGSTTSVTAGIRAAASDNQSSPSARDHDGSRCRGDNNDDNDDDTARHGGGEALKTIRGGGASKGPKARGGKKRKKEDDGGGGGAGDGGGEGEVDGDGDGEADDGGGKAAAEEIEDPNENPKQRAK